MGCAPIRLDWRPSRRLLWRCLMALRFLRKASSFHKSLSWSRQRIQHKFKLPCAILIGCSQYFLPRPGLVFSAGRRSEHDGRLIGGGIGHRAAMPVLVHEYTHVS
mmetsp:Transcript_173922/g.557472  ORF Transcript_173922/g.557472 Transcript_173922/m.557472 type:complete len:105 (-) Transcript_173922:474-788(-)